MHTQVRIQATSFFLTQKLTWSWPYWLYHRRWHCTHAHTHTHTHTASSHTVVALTLAALPNIL